MLSEVIKKLIETLDSQTAEDELGDPFLSSHNYRVYPLNVDYFKPIEGIETDRKLAFLDGGNQELIGAPDFSVQLNRIYFNIFMGTRRIYPKILPQKIEFFSMTYAKPKESQLFYDTSLFPVRDTFAELIPNSSDLSFNSMDRRIITGGSRANISRVASIARRFAEWEFAKHVVDNELGEEDILVMDGTLRTAFTNESDYARSAYAAAKDKGVIYSGLSKTCRLFTTSGIPLLSAIGKLALDHRIPPVWYYYPIAESLSTEHEAAIFVVRLNNQSNRIFRYEIHAEQVKSLKLEEFNEIFSQLSLNSNDLTFPGYPYGLIDADDNARVRHEELEMFRVMLFSEISKIGSSSKFLRHMQSSDAHEVLNLAREVQYP